MAWNNAAVEYLKGVSQNFPGRTEKKLKNLYQNNRCPG
jgi:hypothetical protein